MEPLEEWLATQGIGPRLRAARVQAGLSGQTLAAATGFQQSKISRIESGKQRPSEDDVATWARACGLTGADLDDLQRVREESRVVNTTFRQRMGGGQQRTQRTYTDLVRGSALVRHYETVFIPGPLQIPAYARRVFTEMISLHGLDIDDVDAAVTERLQRAQLLYGTSPRWEILLAEPVLRWLLCPPAVMRLQLDRLQTVIGLQHVRFGIIPMGVELGTSPQNGVQIYAGEETVAVAETFLGETWHRGEEADAYGQALDRLWKEAAEGDAARALITAAVRALPAVEP